MPQIEMNTYQLVDALESQSDALRALFDGSTVFRKVLAGGMTLQTFVDKHPGEFEKLAHIARQRFPGMQDLKQITEEGVVCAWIAKLRFNQDMEDDAFFAHLKKGDAIFSGHQTTLNLKGSPAADNDTISIMWGVQGLTAKQGFDNGATRIRLPEGVAPVIYQALQDGGARQRTSTHAYLTAIDDKGIGKDLEDEAYRKYTPMGYGTLLTYRTYANDADAKSKRVPQDHDLFFKMEDFGFLDKISHTLLHLLGPLKAPFTALVDTGLFHKKSALARSAESVEGSYEKISRKDHLSALGSNNKNDLIRIMDAIQNDQSGDARKNEFNDYRVVNAFRVKFPWPFEKKIVGNDGQQMSLGSFVNKVSLHADYIEALGKGKELKSLKELRAVCQGELCDRREGFEVLVDAASKDRPSQLKSVASLLEEPKRKISLIDKFKLFFGFGAEHSTKVSPEPLPQQQMVNTSTMITSMLSAADAHQSLPLVSKSAKAEPVEGNALEKASTPLMAMIKTECDIGNLSEEKAMQLLNTLQAVVAFPLTENNVSEYHVRVKAYQQAFSDLGKESDLDVGLAEQLNRVAQQVGISLKSHVKAIEPFESESERSIGLGQ